MGVLLGAGMSVQAEVNPARIFDSNMVLQQQKPIRIWGDADAGEGVKVSLGSEVLETKANQDGEWSVEFPARDASKRAVTLKVNALTFENILIGEVWICSGQSNMEFALSKIDGAKQLETNNSLLRIGSHQSIRNVAKGGYSAEELKRCTTETFFEVDWKVSSPKITELTSGVAWVFGNRLQKELDVPVGILPIAVGGSAMNNWLPAEVAKSNPVTKDLYTSDWLTQPTVNEAHQQRMRDAFKKVLKPGQSYKVGELDYRWLCEPDFLFESGIAPLQGLSFRGVIWYQGEADSRDEAGVERARTLLPLLIGSWREYLQQGDFPFLYVQLPGYGKGAWPSFRELQRKTLESVSNTGMSVSIDLGNRKNIHPKDKVPIGERLAVVALKQSYGEGERLGFPKLAEVKRVDGGVELRFEELGSGFKKVKGAVSGFEIATRSDNYVPAQAELKGNDHILLKGDAIQKVRYAWEGYPEPKVQLYNAEGLPLGPFEVEVRK
jgi:sialate O-acetylesterase